MADYETILFERDGTAKIGRHYRCDTSACQGAQDGPAPAARILPLGTVGSAHRALRPRSPGRPDPCSMRSAILHDRGALER